MGGYSKNLQRTLQPN